ncbi:MAG: hypothetical protein U0905_09705 [Pirellulales bacterium]
MMTRKYFQSTFGRYPTDELVSPAMAGSWKRTSIPFTYGSLAFVIVFG